MYLSWTTTTSPSFIRYLKEAVPLSQNFENLAKLDQYVVVPYKGFSL
jgi:hypothetical protein